MHGNILFQLKKFIISRHERATWMRVLDKSGIGHKNFWPAYLYPDEEMSALLQAASEITQTSRDRLLKDFGLFLAPSLMKMYSDLINPEWKTLDLIEHTESRMHTAVRTKNLEAKPPRLNIERPGPGEIKINYYSDRRLCYLLKGIALGVAGHYGEQILIDETSCMLEGDSQCTVMIELAD